MRRDPQAFYCRILTWTLEEEMKIKELSNHQWPEVEDEGSVKRKELDLNY